MFTLLVSKLENKQKQTFNKMLSYTFLHKIVIYKLIISVKLHKLKLHIKFYNNHKFLLFSTIELITLLNKRFKFLT